MGTPSVGTVGWRFSPKDEELINYFLRRKINGKEDDVKVIAEIDVCKCEPWELPGKSVLTSDDKEWFFFCRRDQKFPNSTRLNRATRKGYWKATGKDRKIKSKKGGEIGLKRTLVFHIGRAPKGKRTYWVMHEYRTTLEDLDGAHPGQKPYVLCRLFKKDDESISDATEISVELASLSPVPSELSPVETKPEPEPVSFQVNTVTEGECGQALDVNNYCKGESSSAKGHERQAGINLYYLKVFGDLDPNDLSLLESPNMESMGSSLPPHSATDNLYIHEEFQLDCFNNEHDGMSSDLLQTFLSNSLEFDENQGNNCDSSFQFEIPEYEAMNQYELPNMDSGMFLNSNSETQDMSQLVADLETCASNADSSVPAPVTDNTWDSFQELDNMQTHLEYQEGTLYNGSFGSEQFTFPDIVSDTQNNLNNNDDYATHTSIQFRHREPQARPDVSNFIHGTAQRRIRLQTNLGTSLRPTKSVSYTELVSELSKSRDTKPKVTKKLISSLFSPVKPRILTKSHMFIFGLTTVVAIITVYAGIHVCRA